MRSRLTMCLKFQLTNTLTRATVAMAICGSSGTAASRWAGQRLSARRPALNLGTRENGQDEDVLTSDEVFHEPEGGLRELLILAATQDRRVRVWQSRSLMIASYASSPLTLVLRLAPAILVCPTLAVSGGGEQMRAIRPLTTAMFGNRWCVTRVKEPAIRGNFSLDSASFRPEMVAHGLEPSVSFD